MKINFRSFPLTIIILAYSLTLHSQTSFIWGKQFGTNQEEYVMNHTIDKNRNIYVSGKTTGTFTDKNLGKTDGFIMKIDSSGNELWVRQFGTDEDEDVQWSETDTSGNIYITGLTKGAKTHKEDIFVVKYDCNGQQLWWKQYGTDSTDIGKSIYIDKYGFIYVTGITFGVLGKSTFGNADGFLMKLDVDGNLMFINQFGSSENDHGISVTGNNSTIYLCGTTGGDIALKNKGFMDIFTGQFSNNGTLIRYNQFGTEGFDIAMAIKTDEQNNMYLGGTTSGNFGIQQLGEGDAYLIKVDNKGTIIWNRQFGTSKNDGIRDIKCNDFCSGNILVSGVQGLPPA